MSDSSISSFFSCVTQLDECKICNFSFLTVKTMSLFINNKNTIHSAWTRFLKSNFWHWTVALIPAKALFTSRPAYTRALFLPLQITMGFGWQELKGGESLRKLTFSFTCAASLTCFACWKTEMTLIRTQWQLVFYSR